jgi:hypothetical protein
MKEQTAGHPLHDIGERERLHAFVDAVLDVAPRGRRAGRRDQRHVALDWIRDDVDRKLSIGDVRQHVAEGAARSVTAQLGFGRFLHVGQRHDLEDDDLLRRGRAFRDVALCEIAEVVCAGARSRHELDISDRQFAGIGVRLAHGGGQQHIGMLE